MPYLPNVVNIKKKREMISAFLGYNHNARIKDNQFYDMGNMTGEYLPVTSPRSKRGRVRQLTDPNGLFMHDRLCWVDGTDFLL